MSDITNNGWSEWENHVLLTLKRLEDTGIKRDLILNKLVTDIKVMQTKMTMRAGFTGALAGFIPAIGVAIYAIIKLKNGTPP